MRACVNRQTGRLIEGLTTHFILNIISSFNTFFTITVALQVVHPPIFNCRYNMYIINLKIGVVQVGKMLTHTFRS